MHSEIHQILDFLRQLGQNNSRDWFTENKAQYEKSRLLFKNIIQQLIEHISAFDKSLQAVEAKDCIFRIYRDIRFTPDREPYKTNMGAYMAPGGRKSKMAGYYFHLEPENSFAGGGIYCPQSTELKAIRNEIYSEPEAFERIIQKEGFKKEFSEIYGDKLKTAPRGFDKNWEKIHLLRFKSYTVIKQFSDNKLSESNIMSKLLSTYKIQQPFNEYLNTALEE